MADIKEGNPIPPESLKKLVSDINKWTHSMDILTQRDTLNYNIDEPLLWEMDTQRRNGKPALYQAIEDNHHLAITKALDWYAELGATSLLDGTGVKYGTFCWDDGRHAIKNILSPVMLAVQFGTVDTLRLVVTHPAGCDVNMRRPAPFNCRVAHLGSCSGETPCSCWLHKECVDNSCSASRDGMDNFMSCETALHMAIRAQSTAKLRILLEAGAELPSPPPHRNWYRTANLEDLVAESFQGSFADGGMVHEEMMNIVKMFNERQSSMGVVPAEP